MPPLMVLREAALRDLISAVASSLPSYRASGYMWKFREEELLQSSAVPALDSVELTPPEAFAGPRLAENEVTNSIRIYEYLGPMTRTQAADRRLWTVLTHAVWPDYVRGRWAFRAADADAVKDVRSHWFVEGGLRGLRRNALSRLWWAVALTRPSAENLPDVHGVIADDPHAYTRVLFSNQDIYQGLLEREFGSNSKIRIAVLETLRLDGGESPDSDDVKAFFKIINLLAACRVLSSLPFNRLLAELRSLWQESRTVAVA